MRVRVERSGHRVFVPDQAVHTPDYVDSSQHSAGHYYSQFSEAETQLQKEWPTHLRTPIQDVTKLGSESEFYAKAWIPLTVPAHQFKIYV